MPKNHQRGTFDSHQINKTDFLAKMLFQPGPDKEGRLIRFAWDGVKLGIRNAALVIGNW